VQRKMIRELWSMRSRLCQLIASLSLILACGSAPAKAHPHVFVDVKVDLVFKDGKVTGIQHQWTFDDLYSAFVTQGVGRNPDAPTEEELLPIAQSNVEALAEYDYFTIVRDAGSKAELSTPTDYAMRQSTGKEKLVTLQFFLPLKKPAKPDDRFAFQVFDPSYFVAFELEKESAITLKNAPKGCVPQIFAPTPLNADDRKILDESAASGLAPGIDFGLKLAGSVHVICP